MNRVLNKSQYKLLKQIFKMRQPILFKTLEKYLKAMYSEERVLVGEDNFLYTIGNIPVLLVAHLDTVHKIPPNEFFYDREENVIWSSEGLGADDRAGVFAILNILNNTYRPHILFTTDEEIGGIGARYCTSIGLEPDVKFVIELDRRGKEDSVFYSCDNPEFEKFINSFGFITDIGSFSDISILCPHWGIAGVNLSIGYEDEHFKTERLYVNHMFETIDKVKNILNKVCDEEVKDYEYVEKKYSFGLGGSGWEKYFEDYLRKHDSALNEICYHCFDEFHPDFMIPAIDGGQYCGDCYSKLFSTCIDCSKPFKDPNKVHIKCEVCRKKGDEEGNDD